MAALSKHIQGNNLHQLVVNTQLPHQDPQTDIHYENGPEQQMHLNLKVPVFLRVSLLCVPEPHQNPTNRTSYISFWHKVLLQLDSVGSERLYGADEWRSTESHVSV